MYLLQMFNALMLGTSLALASVAVPSEHGPNTCTVMACGNPGLNGLPGRDGRDGIKGEKGDSGAILRGQQGFPGKAGPPGAHGAQGAQGTPGQKGQKGESTAVDAVQRQVTALERNIQTLQADLRKIKNVLSLQGALRVGGKTFVSTGWQETFSAGRDLCAKEGAALASPRNAAENTALQEIVKKNSKYAFLDINDIQSEGTFVYLNGARLKDPKTVEAIVQTPKPRNLELPKLFLAT
ncbi:mannose-binding protein-like isoform X2 [Hemicordylus capensis]|uniref:mannose-binding protein-like isoform X2 n=1 Tax=Hemicordylus capensis TaxID=884348 RepID=UPI0023033CD8|nr:mannose-binding protein-like isoform X2 [Hemicordylus capensis]